MNIKMNIKKLIVIGLIGLACMTSSLTTGCAILTQGTIFEGKRTTHVELNILGNTYKSDTNCDGAYNVTNITNTSNNASASVSK